MKKRWLSIVLVLALLLGMVPALSATVSAASAMTASNELMVYLKKIEGFSQYPYWDYGQWTVGYGTACPADKLAEYQANGITEAAAEALFRQELVRFETSVNQFIDQYGLTMAQHQFDALVTFSYNCGAGWTRESDGFFNQMVRSGNTGTAFIYAICLWCKAGGECILLDRRMSEADMYINGVYKPYNDTGFTYPDTYRWVFLDGGGGTVRYNIHGFDANDPTPVGATFTKTPTGKDSSGNSFTYQFAGWYTASGKKVEQLDSSIAKDTVLYAKWKDPAGKIVSLSNTGPVNVRVTVTREDITVRSGPGTHSSRLGTAAYGSRHTVTEIFPTANYTWGKTARGWIVLEFTNYGKDGWLFADGHWTYYKDGVQVKNAWAKDSKGWCYLDANGHLLTNGWAEDSKGWCYLDASGHLLTNGWAKDSKGWCYLDSTGHITTDRWVKDANGWRYVDENGYMVTEDWLKDSVGWCYVSADGYCVTDSWMADSQGLCYLDRNGRMVISNWVNDGVGWAWLNHRGYRVYNTWQACPEGRRYLGADGYALTSCWHEDAYLNSEGVAVLDDWVCDDTGWCYLDAQGKKLTNTWKEAPEGMRYLGENGYAVKSAWVQDRYLDDKGLMAVSCWVMKDSHRCFVGKDGYVVCDDWVYDGIGWSYTDENGEALTLCWKKDTKGWCYLGENGYCLTDTWQKDSVGLCYLDASGRMVYDKWVKDANGWRYVGQSGYLVTNKWVKDTVGWCYVGDDGYCLTSTWKQDSVGWCYLDANGRLLTNDWARDSVGWCYLDGNGYCLKNTSRTIDGVTYHFNAAGNCTNR